MDQPLKSARSDLEAQELRRNDDAPTTGRNGDFPNGDAPNPDDDLRQPLGPKHIHLCGSVNLSEIWFNLLLDLTTLFPGVCGIISFHDCPSVPALTAFLISVSSAAFLTAIIRFVYQIPRSRARQNKELCATHLVSFLSVLPLVFGIWGAILVFPHVAAYFGGEGAGGGGGPNEPFNCSGVVFLPALIYTCITLAILVFVIVYVIMAIVLAVKCCLLWRDLCRDMRRCLRRWGLRS